MQRQRRKDAGSTETARGGAAAVGKAFSPAWHFKTNQNCLQMWLATHPFQSKFAFDVTSRF